MVYSLALEFGKLSNLIVWVLTQSIHKGKIKTCVIIKDNTKKTREYKTSERNNYQGRHAHCIVYFLPGHQHNHCPRVLALGEYMTLISSLFPLHMLLNNCDIGSNDSIPHQLSVQTMQRYVYCIALFSKDSP